LIIGGVSALAVVIIVSIVLTVVLVNKKDDEDLRESVSLDDYLNGKLSARRFNGTWIDGKSFHYFDDAVSLVY
jgi:cobalamin biosynthesis Mg chelatase CobN